MITLIILIGLILLFFIFLIYFSRMKFDHQLKKLNGKIVVITGGSLGIGRSLALKCFQHGSNVVIIARNQQNLNKIKDELELKRINDTQKIVIKQADVTSVDQIDQVFKEIIDKFKQIDYLINCAGKSVSNSFDDQSIEDFKLMMNLNYFGTIYPTKFAVKQMKKQKSGNIIIVSSIAGLVGLYGFSAYSGSKFALVGLAQCLHMELKSFNIHVTCCFPPDTDTPGFEEEEKTKPPITKLICEAGGLENPDDVAANLLKDCFNKKFVSTIGFTNRLVTIAASGMMPITSYLELGLEIISMGFCRLCTAIYLIGCHRIINSNSRLINSNQAKFN